MNIENMTDEEKRVKIHEAKGGKIEYIGTVAYRYPAYMGQPREERELPDYLNDLNAMNDAERVILKKDNADVALPIPPRNWLTYLDNLILVSNLDYEAHATARQRADAFLLTL